MRFKIQNILAALVVMSAVGLGLAPAQKAAAVDVVNPVCQNADPNNLPSICKEQTNTNPLFGPTGILTKVVRILSFVVGIAAVIVIIIAGLRFMVSGGDPAKVASARNAIIYAAVGVAIAAVAQFIVAFILTKL